MMCASRSSNFINRAFSGAGSALLGSLAWTIAPGIKRLLNYDSRNMYKTPSPLLCVRLVD